MIDESRRLTLCRSPSILPKSFPVAGLADWRSVLRQPEPRPLACRRLRALAMVALAIGAVAFGAVAIGRLVIGRARIRRLEIDELVVGKLVIKEGREDSTL